MESAIENDKIKSEVNDIPLKSRRFDSLAWLVQGDSKCGAACFDGDTLLLATNEDEQWLFTAIRDYLVHVSVTSYGLANKLNSAIDERGTKKPDVNFIFEMNKLCNQQRKSCKIRMENVYLIIKGYLKTRGRKESLFNNSTYETAFLDAIKKITRSIRHTYLRSTPGQSNKTLDILFVDAIRNGKIEFVKMKKPPITTKIGVHAEMKILNYLIDNDKINTNFYIGVSKKCCEKCEVAIRAVNKVYTSNPSEEIISYRGKHGYNFPAECPPFLINHPKIADEFLEFYNVGKSSLEKLTLEEIFKVEEKVRIPGKLQAQDRSASLDENSSEFGEEYYSSKSPEAFKISRFGAQGIIRNKSNKSKDELSTSIEDYNMENSK